MTETMQLERSRSMRMRLFLLFMDRIHRQSQNEKGRRRRREGRGKEKRRKRWGLNIFEMEQRMRMMCWMFFLPHFFPSKHLSLYSQKGSFSSFPLSAFLFLSLSPFSLFLLSFLLPSCVYFPDLQLHEETVSVLTIHPLHPHPLKNEEWERERESDRRIRVRKREEGRGKNSGKEREEELKKRGRMKGKEGMIDWRMDTVSDQRSEGREKECNEKWMD